MMIVELRSLCGMTPRSHKIGLTFFKMAELGFVNEIVKSNSHNIHINVTKITVIFYMLAG